VEETSAYLLYDSYEPTPNKELMDIPDYGSSSRNSPDAIIMSTHYVGEH
jgi:hypothetical protein